MNSDSVALDLAFEAFWEKEYKSFASTLNPELSELLNVSLRCAYYAGASYGVNAVGVEVHDKFKGKDGK